MTPEELDKLSPDAAKNPDKYKPWIGQSIYVKINGVAYPFVLIGVAHDDLADGSGKAGFTFKANAIVGYISKSSNGMWDKTDGNGSSGKTTPSYLRIAMRDDVFPKIEDNYKNVIKEVKKEIDYGLVDIDKGDHYKNVNLITTRDKLWALSLTEILGNSYKEGVIPNYLDYKVDLDNTAQYHEGSQYEYFDKLTVIGSDTAERLLDVPTSFSGEKIYGLRTNTYSYTGSLAVYKTSGYTNEALNVWNFRNNLNMTERIGILPCFCI